MNESKSEDSKVHVFIKKTQRTTKSLKVHSKVIKTYMIIPSLKIQ